MALERGQKYLLSTDNEHLDGATAVVAEVMSPPEDGLELVLVNWTRDDRRGQYRALASELRPVQSPQQQGFTGNVCPHCYGQKMVRAGACEVCTECGTSGGCG